MQSSRPCAESCSLGPLALATRVSRDPTRFVVSNDEPTLLDADGAVHCFANGSWSTRGAMPREEELPVEPNFEASGPIAEQRFVSTATGALIVATLSGHVCGPPGSQCGFRHCEPRTRLAVWRAHDATPRRSAMHPADTVPIATLDDRTNPWFLRGDSALIAPRGLSLALPASARGATLWAASNTLVVALEHDGVARVGHVDGTWTVVPSPSPAASTALRAIALAGLHTTRPWLVYEDGSVAQWSHDRFAPVAARPPENVRALEHGWLSDGAALYAYDGTRWLRVPPPGAYRPGPAWTTRSGLWALAVDGPLPAVLAWDGARWHVYASARSRAERHSVQRPAPSDEEEETIPAAIGRARASWVSPQGARWVSSTMPGIVARQTRDGVWTRFHTRSATDFNELVGLRDDDVWLATGIERTSNGTPRDTYALHWNGRVFERHDLPSVGVFVELWPTAHAGLWLGNDGMPLARWTGACFQRIDYAPVSLVDVGLEAAPSFVHLGDDAHDTTLVRPRGAPAACGLAEVARDESIPVLVRIAEPRPAATPAPQRTRR